MSLQLVSDKDSIPVFNYSESKFEILQNEVNKRFYLFWINPPLDPNIDFNLSNLFYEYYKNKGLKYAPFEIKVGEIFYNRENGIVHLLLDGENNFIWQCSLYLFNMSEHFMALFTTKEWE